MSSGGRCSGTTYRNWTVNKHVGWSDNKFQGRWPIGAFGRLNLAFGTFVRFLCQISQRLMCCLNFRQHIQTNWFVLEHCLNKSIVVRNYNNPHRCRIPLGGGGLHSPAEMYIATNLVSFLHYSVTACFCFRYTFTKHWMVEKISPIRWLQYKQR